MNSTHALRLFALAALGPLAAAPGFAQSENYFYGGLSAGQGRAKLDENEIARKVLGSGISATVVDRDERGRAYKIFGGYQLNRNIGFEAGYYDLGRSTFNATTTPSGNLRGDLRFRGLNFDVVGTLPITDKLSAIGRVGAAFSRTRGSFVGSGGATVTQPSPTDRQTNPKAGVGLQYAFTPGLMMRVEAERYGVSDGLGKHGRVSAFTVGLVVPFGRGSAAPRMSSLAPVVVAEAPPPAPPPVVVSPPAAPVMPVALPPPQPPTRVSVSLSAESLFDFDLAQLRPEGKAALDSFQVQLRGMRFDTITVSGHTDRLGSTEYNQTLSQQRAEAVKAYLLGGSDGVDGGKVTAVGKSEAQPITKTDDCKGNRPSSSLIACLQPDRRVEVEVTGSR